MIQKTRKSFLERFRVTKRGKVLHKSPHQNHFRAKKSGGAIRNSRILKKMAKPEVRNILKQIPFH